MTLIDGRPFGEALNATLKALGKPALILDQLFAPEREGAEDHLTNLNDALASAGLTAQLLELPPGPLPRMEGVAVLAALSDQDHWQAFWLRPGGDADARIDDTGTPHPIPEDWSGPGGRAYLLTELVEQPLVISFKPFLRRNAHLITPMVLGGLLGNVLSLVLPLFGSFVYDKVLGNGITETLWAVAIGVLLAQMMDFTARALRIQMIERVAISTEGDIDRAMLRNLFRKSGAMPPVGMVLDKYKQTLASRDFVSSSYLLAAADVPFLLLYLGVIAYVSGPLALVPVVIGVFVVILNLLFKNTAIEYDNESRKASEQRVTLLADVMMAREAVITSPLRDEFARRWTRLSDAASRASGRARYWTGLAGSVNICAYSFAYVSVMIGGAYMVEDRTLTSGGMLAASMLTSRAMSTIASLVLLITRFEEFRRALREMEMVLPSANMPEPPVRANTPSGHLRIVDLEYRPRKESRAVLQGLDLRIQPGEIVGLAGLPGAGKTSLLRLLAGIERPTSGQVLLDMLPVHAWNPRQLARSVGYKPQEALLFDGTLEENVRAGNEQATTEQLQAALGVSGLLQAFDRGELTLATPVGPRGAYLSGGQRQMVALARSLLGEPPLLLLDEPTTGFDHTLEQNLAAHVATWSGKRTAVISTHSRALLGACSRIIVLNQGRVGADGPRDKVLGA